MMEESRYHRQEILPGFGTKAQEKLCKSTVLIVGCGALGCAAAQYLVRAGVGHLIIIDDDVITFSNLHRQVLFDENDVGKSKVEVAASKLQMANAEVNITPIKAYLQHSNGLSLVEACDLILDGSDRFSTKYLSNDLAVKYGKPMIYGAVNRFDGQLAVFNLLVGNDYSANMRNLFPRTPAADDLGNCEVNGVLGPVAGIIGNMMAAECIKILTGCGEPLINRLLMLDVADYRMHFMKYDHREKSKNIVDDHITWKAYFEGVKQNNYQLFDVRNAQERAQHKTDGAHLIVNDENLRMLKPVGIPVFHCVSGYRAAKALYRFKELHPNVKAFFIDDTLK